MSKRPVSYGLKQLKAAGQGRTAVVLHGIRQTRDALEPLARIVADKTSDLDVFIYGYDHTRPLEENGRLLHSTLAESIPQGQINLVGYSMGGLVSRLAASQEYPHRIHTIVTLATPNRGSLSNAELTTLGQIGRSVFELISPLAPRAAGVKDLTRAAEIMSSRRSALLSRNPTIAISAKERRYVSIPALFYNKNIADFRFGPSIQMSAIVAGFMLLGLKHRLEKMERSHDGIVTENSNNISTAESHDWSEVHLVHPASDARWHAAIDRCSQHDHSSIISEPDIAVLIGALLSCPDWRELFTTYPALRNTVRIASASK